MRKLYLAYLGVIVFLLIIILHRPRYEGFSNAGTQGNYVLDLLGHLKRTTITLANPQLWKERMSMMGKSPVELAREYIKISGQTRNASA